MFLPLFFLSKRLQFGIGMMERFVFFFFRCHAAMPHGRTCCKIWQYIWQYTGQQHNHSHIIWTEFVVEMRYLCSNLTWKILKNHLHLKQDLISVLENNHIKNLFTHFLSTIDFLKNYNKFTSISLLIQK